MDLHQLFSWNAMHLYNMQTKNKALKKISAAIISTLALASTSFALTITNGDYNSKGKVAMGLRLIVLDIDKSIIAANLDVGSDGCGGEISGVGQAKGNILTFTPYVKFDAEDSCSIKVVFDKDDKTITIKENNCSPYHGASCGFDGKLTKARR